MTIKEIRFLIEKDIHINNYFNRAIFSFKISKQISINPAKNTKNTGLVVKN